MKLSLLNFIKLWVFIIFCSIIVSGCQDAILVGGDLLDDEKIHVDVINDFDISTATIPGIKVVTYTPNRDLKQRTYRIGEINDDIYGKTAADIYLKFGFNVSAVPTFTVEENAKFDSLVLVLKYDSLSIFGKSPDFQSVKIYQLEETYKSSDTFYSDTKLNYLPTPIFDQIKYINPKDSVTITDHKTGKTVKLTPQMRMKINDDFARSIFENNTLTNDTLFRNFFKGIYITSKSTDNNSLLYGFDLSSAALSPTTPYNKLIMYYTVSDTVKKTYEFLIDDATINSYQLDYTGAAVANFLNQPQLGDSLIFTQGFGGVKTEIKFNDLDKIQNLLINKAELEIFIADIPNTSGIFKNPTQIIATTKNKKGNYEFIEDIALPLALNTSFVPSFGGYLIRTTNGYKYTLNITNHLKKAIRDSNFSPTIYISVLTESENPERVAFYGAKHSQLPVKLNVYYTKN